MENTNNTITRYISTPPADAVIAGTNTELVELQQTNLGAVVDPENGGYYLHYPKGKVVAIADDGLCSIIDEKYMALIFHFERKGQHEEANEVMEDLRKAGIDADKLKAEASNKINGVGNGNSEEGSHDEL